MLIDMLFHLAERRIEEAQRAGLFEGLPGQGKPLAIDLLEDVPAELRSAYSVLRAAGCIPETLERRRERLRLEDLLRCCEDPDRAAELRRQLLVARLREDIARG